MIAWYILRCNTCNLNTTKCLSRQLQLVRPFPRGRTSWRCAWYRAYVRCSLRRTSMARICAKRTSQKCKCEVWIFHIWFIIILFLGPNPMEFSLVAFSWSQCFFLYLCPFHSMRTLPRTRLRGVNQRPFHTIRWLMISNNCSVFNAFLFVFCYSSWNWLLLYYRYVAWYSWASPTMCSICAGGTSYYCPP